MIQYKSLYILILSALFISCKEKTLFKRVSSSHSGIHFNNQITETDSTNIIDLENIYNGGGVGMADFNNDGLQDIYFTGNMVENKLYLNKGNLKFEDITHESGVEGEGKWSRGVSIVDINNDGWQDIYISCTILKDSVKRENILYINTGLNKDGIPVFKDEAKEYGLNDNSHTTQSAFFDYDNDGDLDVYMAINVFARRDNPNGFRKILMNGEHPNTDRLYRNEWDSVKRHPVFTNVSRQTGILQEGFAHSVTICDINTDGWKDIFVANDYLSEDLLYINNGNGTFTNRAKDYFKHTAYNAMGADVVDINNDGLSDVIELDMNPEDNYRKKTMMNSGNYQSYIYNNSYSYQYQYVRNMLHINMGWPGDVHDTLAHPVFAETGFYSGIAETDWSWTPLVADYDNDGLRDIIITNGFPRDVTDHDFMVYRNTTFAMNDRKKLLSLIPEVKIPNYCYKNTGNLKFENHSKDWGFSLPTFSNGAACGDLDNDGDLDVIINNINDEALVYENTLNNGDEKAHNYLKVKLKSSGQNQNAFGAWVTVYSKNGTQVYEMNPVRGYLSSNEYCAWVGLDSIKQVDSVVVIWPDNLRQIKTDISVNKEIVIEKDGTSTPYLWQNGKDAGKTYFKEISRELGINCQDSTFDFNDYNIQPLLPHKLSEIGPAIATGDINGDKLEDLIVGESGGKPLSIYSQQTDGKFIKKEIHIDLNSTEADLALFDADNDNDLDLYLCRGGYQQQPGSDVYADKLYLNDGKGNFSYAADALPINTSSKSCVRIIDFDKDGDSDIFIGGRVQPWDYPKPVSGYILRNDSKVGNVKFTDVTKEIAPGLIDIGLVCDAQWADYNNDGWNDLIIAGEWMPVTFFKNKNGKFENETKLTGVADKKGWWNCLASGDFDKDGDIDFIAGNTGLNSFFTFNEAYPVTNYYRDFDNNGRAETITSKFLKDKKGVYREFIANGRDDIIGQVPSLKKKYLSYSSFADVTIDKVFTADQWKGALKAEANYFKTCLLRNNGKGVFTTEPLPYEAQLSSIKEILVYDYNHDGLQDLLMTGNDYSFEVSNGRLDAFNGLLLKGQKDGNFMPALISESGLFIPGDGKKLKLIKRNDGKDLIIAAQHNGPLRVFTSLN